MGIFQSRSEEKYRLKEDCFSFGRLAFCRQAGISKLFQTDYRKSYKADEYADNLIPGEGFVIKRPSHKNQQDCKKRTLHDGSCADLPSRLIRIYEANFKPHDCDTKHERRPIQLMVFLKQISWLLQEKIKQNGYCGANQICDRQRGKWI